MSSHPQLDLTNDELLRTTRAVRKRLDFDREVEDSVLRECLEIAVQAPTGSNAQGWQFVFVRDAAKKAKIGEYYAQVWEEYKTAPYAIHNLHRGTGDSTQESSQERSTGFSRVSGSQYWPRAGIDDSLRCRAHGYAGSGRPTGPGINVRIHHSGGLELHACGTGKGYRQRLDNSASAP